MSLDEEMMIWEERSNDEFGKLLKDIKEHVKDYFVVEEDEYGLPSTPLDTYITYYSVYGHRKSVASNVINLLKNYDILGNDEDVDNLVKELKEIC